MSRTTVAGLIMLLFSTCIVLYNVFVLSPRRNDRLNELYDKLFKASKGDENEKAIIHCELMDLNDEEVWSYQFTIALWVFSLIGFIVFLVMD